MSLYPGKGNPHGVTYLNPPSPLPLLQRMGILFI
jgi:hypothetical protein